MELTIYPIAMAVASVATLLSGLWLALHLTALSHLFSGKADVVASRKQPAASRAMALTMLAVFNVGWLTCLIIWIVLI